MCGDQLEIGFSIERYITSVNLNIYEKRCKQKKIDLLFNVMSAITDINPVLYIIFCLIMI